MTPEFHAETQRSTFHSPLEDFEEVTVELQIREDPLTGRTARIVPESLLLPEEEPDIAEVVEDDEGCFFCPGTVEEATPTYPEWMPRERDSRGEATGFPNLNPYGSYSNVVALTEDHYRPLDELGAGAFEDGLAAALDFVGDILDHDDDAAFASVNMNFLRPAGSSLVHPHLQTLVDDRGTNEQRRLVEASREYRDRHGEGYWRDLVEAERGGDRHVATTGNVEWLAPFAPRHHRHLLGIAPVPDVLGSDDDAVGDLARGIDAILNYYAAAGHNSFNFALHLAPDEPLPPVVELVARSVFDRYYWSDSPFFTVLHGEGVVDVAPEEYAAAAAEHF